MSLLSSCTDYVSITSFEVRNEIEIYLQSKGRREKTFFNASSLLRAPVDVHAARALFKDTEQRVRASWDRERLLWFGVCPFSVLELGCKMVFMCLSILNTRVNVVGISLLPAKGNN